ncbi:(4Fe-4S)-binding protein [Flavobacterium sp. ZS1P70]|uniref:(4Fe-4S)-binding protein n=1 Tax=Flavobacterium zhoui TaxID=3230414 RepID=A0ABW6I139_9FLAO
MGKTLKKNKVTAVRQAGKCVHSGNCVRKHPAVFEPKEKPWIKIESSSTEKIIDTVKKCPSGALTYYKNK